ncbi:glycosyltransferase family 2 protein [Providencia rettgeri]|uniref:glycosyltransferase family 2 protein n=1 Tax=Providencia rettgeri TaxID=587 RepID=UPI002940A3D6|nr:glycosyltransferase family 2 protein [Providencia rettgeri]ELR5223350.1 glycosyltransferase family 2 protein [Providencia rettgeri]MDX7323550.1 glycosyltransferase family 2 protein [Providencia rettgeri]
MINKPLVSIILPVYNAEKYLSEALESLKEQTYKNIEIFCINDGSTDNSLNILNKHKENDPRIQIISKKNEGLPTALNTAISFASGKYIARMDSDDICELNRIELQVKYLEDNPDIGVCGTNANVFGNNTSKIVFKGSSDILKAYLIYNVCFVHPSVMFRKKIITTAPYDAKYKCAQDYRLWTSLASVTNFSNLNSFLINYRVNEESITSKVDKDRNETKKQFIKTIQNEYLKKSGINLSEKNLELHFYLTERKYIQGNEFTLSDVKNLIDEIELNFEKNLFSKSSLTSVINMKFFQVVIYKITSKKFEFIPGIFNMRFLFGAINHLRFKM